MGTPEPTRPDTNSTRPTRPEPTRPEPTRPEPTRPESTTPEPTRPDTNTTRPTRPEPTRPETTRPEPTRPEMFWVGQCAVDDSDRLLDENTEFRGENTQELCMEHCLAKNYSFA